MVGLLDIGPRTEEVPLDGGASLTVRGMSANGIINVLSRFPEIEAIVGGKGDGIDAKRLIAIGGDVVTAVIAAGCGYPGNAEAEAAAATLPVEAQLDVLEAVFRLTFPKGPGPFLERLNALGAGGLSAGAKTPATKSPRR